MLLTKEAVVKTQLFELILAIKRKCQSRLENIQKDLGLSPAEFNGLIVMNDGQEIPGSSFAERMGLSASRGSRVLNKLVTNGYLKTRCNTRDRRTISISLTAGGKRMRSRILNRITACESRICAKLDKQQIKQVRHALEILEAAL